VPSDREAVDAETLLADASVGLVVPERRPNVEAVEAVGAVRRPCAEFVRPIEHDHAHAQGREVVVGAVELVPSRNSAHEERMRLSRRDDLIPSVSAGRRGWWCRGRR
jgi:hypothetical protein